MFEQFPSQYGRLSSSGFDKRQQEFVETGEFWRLYNDDLHELFRALGKEAIWSEDPDDWLPMARDRWMGEDHGPSDEKEKFDDKQCTAALKVLDRIGLTGELVPPPGHYREAIILGGRTTALYKRIPWLFAHGITSDRISILAGHRPAVEGSDGTREELLSTDSRFGGRDLSDDAWSQWAIRGGRKLEESHLARLVVSKTLGQPVLRRVDWGVTPSSGDRYPQDYYFTVRLNEEYGSKEQEIAIVHGEMASRGGRKTRPTTASTFIEWLERLAPEGGSEANPIQVVVLSGNPHTSRTIEELSRIRRQLGRSDIELVPAGTIQAKGTPLEMVQTALGEVVRLVDRDPTAHRSLPQQVA